MGDESIDLLIDKVKLFDDETTRWMAIMPMVDEADKAEVKVLFQDRKSQSMTINKEVDDNKENW